MHATAARRCCWPPQPRANSLWSRSSRAPFLSAAGRSSYRACSHTRHWRPEMNRLRFSVAHSKLELNMLCPRSAACLLIIPNRQRPEVALMWGFFDWMVSSLTLSASHLSLMLSLSVYSPDTSPVSSCPPPQLPDCDHDMSQRDCFAADLEDGRTGNHCSDPVSNPLKSTQWETAWVVLSES